MRKRFVGIAAACILALPLLFSASQSDKPTAPSPYAAVALAGHTTVGGWCDCGSPGCICDPDEIGGNINAPTTDDPDDLTQSDPDVSPGAGILMLALAFLLWTRLRA